MSAHGLAQGTRRFSALELFNAVHYSTSQANTTLLSGLDDVLAQSSLHLAPGDIVELQGGPSSGKTSLLLLLTLIATLPPKLTLACQDGRTLEVDVGGKGKGVVWADCDRKSDLVRLANLLRAHVERVVKEALASEAELGRTFVRRELDQQIGKVVSSSLTNLVVVRPTSTLQLAATIESLPALWLSQPRPGLLHLIIDGMSSFCWQDQRDFELRPSRPTSSTSTSTLPSSTPPIRLLLCSLAHLRSVLAPTTFLTQFILQPSAITHPASSALPQRLGLGFVQHHLTTPYPLITAPAYVGPPGDPLRAPLLLNSGSPTVVLKLHVTCYRLPAAGMKGGTGLKEALKKRREGVKVGAGGRGERFVGLVRAAGGKELGAWEWEVEDDLISA